MEPERNREEDETRKKPWEPLGGLGADVGTCLTSGTAGRLKAQLEKPRFPSGADRNRAGSKNDNKALRLEEEKLKLETCKPEADKCAFPVTRHTFFHLV